MTFAKSMISDLNPGNNYSFSNSSPNGIGVISVKSDDAHAIQINNAQQDGQNGLDSNQPSQMELDPYIIAYCSNCKSHKPPRTHHCSRCSRCVMRMDHHCDFLDVCIGSDNIKFFLQFLLSSLSFILCSYFALG